MAWFDVEQAVSQAKSIAWDGCHKIYILLDDEQTRLMEALAYRDNDTPGGSRLFTSKEMTPKQMLETVSEWYDASCALRFINSVKTNREDPNAGFTTLISQFESKERSDA